MKPVKILILLPAWKRPEILEVTLRNIRQLMAYDPDRFQIQCFCVYSDDSSPPVLRKYGIDMGYHNNLPVGTKKNAALTAIMENYDFDYLMEMGSDDVLSPELLEKYEPYFHSGAKFFGIDGCWLYDTASSSYSG